MLFSAWQATTHALQPMHFDWSIDHAPLVAVVRERRIHRGVGRRAACRRRRNSGARRFARNSSTVPARTMCRPSIQWCSCVEANSCESRRSCGARSPARTTSPRSCAADKRPRRRRSHAAGLLASVTELHADRSRRHVRASRTPAFHAAVGRLDFDDVARFEPAFLCQLRTHERGVVPGEFRERPRQLLEPAVVREPAVPH